MNILNWKMCRVRERQNCKITSLWCQNLNKQIIYFQSQGFHLPFVTLQSMTFKFFAEIMKGIFFVNPVVKVTLEIPSRSNDKALILLRKDVFTRWKECIPRKRKKDIKHNFQMLFKFLVKSQTPIGTRYSNMKNDIKVHCQYLIKFFEIFQ